MNPSRFGARAWLFCHCACPYVLGGCHGATRICLARGGILEHVPVDIDGVRTFADFEVIEIVDDSCPYPTLLGIDWDFNNSTMVYLKKIRMMFEGDGLMVIMPLDPDEGHKYI